MLTSTQDAGKIAGAVVGSILGVVIIIGAIVFIILRSRNLRLPFSSPQQSWDIPYSEIVKEKLLSQGNSTVLLNTPGAYGEVWKGTWRNADVAIKELKNQDQSLKNAFMMEATLMMYLPFWFLHI